MPFLITKDGTSELTYSQTRRAGLRSPTRGVRTGALATSWLDDVAALALTLPRGAAFSHTTAAQLLGLPTPRPDERPFHVTVPMAVNRGSRKAIAWHQRDLTSCTLLHEIPVTDCPRTWLDLGTSLSMPDLVAVTDVMLRRRLVRVTDLEVVPGTRGAATLRKAAELADPRSRSVRESLLRVQLHSSGLPPPSSTSTSSKRASGSVAAILSGPTGNWCSSMTEFTTTHSGSAIRTRKPETRTPNTGGSA